MPVLGLRSTMFRPPLPVCCTQGKTRRSHITSTAIRGNASCARSVAAPLMGARGFLAAQLQTRLGGIARARGSSRHCDCNARLPMIFGDLWSFCQCRRQRTCQGFGFPEKRVDFTVSVESRLFFNHMGPALTDRPGRPRIAKILV